MGRTTYFSLKKVSIFIHCPYDFEYTLQTLRFELPANNYHATLARGNA